MSRWSWTLPLLLLAACNSTDMLTGAPDEARAVTVTPPISLAVEAAPASFRLYAGQDTPIGTVQVYNDATTMYLTIKLIDGWCMTESHVAVAEELADIPQKNGNPIPGLFPYGDTYPGCDDEDSFEIPLTGLGLAPVIAVHAKAWEMVESTVEIASNAGDDISTKYAYSDPWPTATAAVVPDFAAGALWAVIAGADYISNVAAADGPGINVWRRVTETLTLPANVLPLSGTLEVNSDNYEFTRLNGVEIERDDLGPAVTVENTAPDPLAGSPYTWGLSKTVGFTPTVGANNFEFIFRNAIYTGENPTGVSYRAVATYYAHGESAWAGRQMFSGKNWATYFTYAVTHGVMSNQNGYGVIFDNSYRGLKFFAYEGASANQGWFVWRSTSPANPTNAFSGVITSASKNSSTGVWTLVTKITATEVRGGPWVTASGPSPAYIGVGCEWTFKVKDGTPDQVQGWTWAGSTSQASSSCSFAPVTTIYTVQTGTITEF